MATNSIINLKRPESIRELPKWRKELFGTMNPALQKRCSQVEDYVAEGLGIVLKRTWHAGKMVREIQENESKFGPGAMEQLLAYVGYDHRSALVQAVHFYKDFSEKELADLLAMRTRYSQRPIGWMYIQKLLAIDDRTVRMQLLRRICDEELTPEQLDHAIDEIKNRTSGQRHAGGRPIAIPHTLGGRLSRLERGARNLVRDSGAIYRHPDLGFLHAIEDLAPDRVTPELIKAIDRDLQLVSQLKDITDGLVEELTKTREIAAARAAEHARKLADKNRDVPDAEATPAKPVPRLEHKPDAGQDGAKAKKGRKDKARHEGNGTAKRGAQVPAGVS